MLQVEDYEIPASHAHLVSVDWPDLLDESVWEVKVGAGTRVVRGSMGLRGWLSSDWIKRDPVPLGNFVLDRQLPRGKILPLPLGLVGTGPDQVTHWGCPCGSFKVEVNVPPAHDK